MEQVLDVNPGLIIWTIVNFSIFLLILLKFGYKPIKNGMAKRQQSIQDSIDQADKSNAEARQLLIETQARLDASQQEMYAIVAKGKVQSEELIKKAQLEADHLKRQKIVDAVREIDQSKELAIKELRKEVAGLVVGAAEKIIGSELDNAKHLKLIDNYIEKIPSN
jgi:F-type H+-transporting ATPase subunit b